MPTSAISPPVGVVRTTRMLPQPTPIIAAATDANTNRPLKPFVVSIWHLFQVELPPRAPVPPAIRMDEPPAKSFVVTVALSSVRSTKLPNSPGNYRENKRRRKCQREGV